MKHWGLLIDVIDILPAEFGFGDQPWIWSHPIDQSQSERQVILEGIDITWR
jgi:hypothetical protein